MTVSTQRLSAGDQTVYPVRLSCNSMHDMHSRWFALIPIIFLAFAVWTSMAAWITPISQLRFDEPHGKCRMQDAGQQVDCGVVCRDVCMCMFAVTSADLLILHSHFLTDGMWSDMFDERMRIQMKKCRQEAALSSVCDPKQNVCMY